VITRLEVDGFKSLRDFAVDLEPFTVFIGPNSAGKSNVLDALALLSRLSSLSVEDAFKQGRGRALDQFTRRGGEAGESIRFGVEVFVPRAFVKASTEQSLPNRYRYELVLARKVVRSGAEHLRIVDEKLTAFDRDSDRWFASHPDLAERAVHANETRDILSQDIEKARARHLHFSPISDTEARSYKVPLSHTALASHRQSLGGVEVEMALDSGTLDMMDDLKKELGLPSRSAVLSHVIVEEARRWGRNPDVKRVDEMSIVADDLSAYRLIHLDSARLKDPSERLGSGTLAPDASNLPTVLANLPAPTLGEIRADLVALVPGICSFEVVPEGDAFRIDFELSGGERLPARLVSDGTLRILGLLTALRADPPPAVIGVEEPENGVYPGRLRKLLDFLREIVTLGPEQDAPSTQLILTTHSPVVLAALRAQPEHLRFVDLVRRDGHLVTRARAVGAAGPDRGSRTISLREIDALLHAADAEIAS
jgi:predicted ATPase